MLVLLCFLVRTQANGLELGPFALSRHLLPPQLLPPAPAVEGAEGEARGEPAVDGAAPKKPHGLKASPSLDWLFASALELRIQLRMPSGGGGGGRESGKRPVSDSGLVAMWDSKNEVWRIYR
mgnify:CR=1 FL=1